MPWKGQQPIWYVATLAGHKVLVIPSHARLLLLQDRYIRLEQQQLTLCLQESSKSVCNQWTVSLRFLKEKPLHSLGSFLSSCCLGLSVTAQPWIVSSRVPAHSRYNATSISRWWLRRLL